MATAVFSFKIDEDGKVRVLHVFFAANKTTAEAELKAHADGCPKFGPAWRTNQTIEFARELQELPPADGDELEEWLDTLLSSFEETEDDPIDMIPE